MIENAETIEYCWQEEDIAAWYMCCSNKNLYIYGIMDWGLSKSTREVLKQ